MSKSSYSLGYYVKSPTRRQWILNRLWGWVIFVVHLQLWRVVTPGARYSHTIGLWNVFILCPFCFDFLILSSLLAFFLCVGDNTLALVSHIYSQTEWNFLSALCDGPKILQAECSENNISIKLCMQRTSTANCLDSVRPCDGHRNTAVLSPVSRLCSSLLHLTGGTTALSRQLRTRYTLHKPADILYSCYSGQAVS